MSGNDWKWAEITENGDINADGNDNDNEDHLTMTMFMIQMMKSPTRWFYDSYDCL